MALHLRFAKGCAHGRSGFARDAQHFLDRGHALDRLAQAVLVHGLHAFAHGRGTQLGGGCVLHHQAAQRIGHRQDFDDADATRRTGLSALRAALGAPKRDLVARGREAREPQLGHDLRQGGVVFAAMHAERAHQPLGDDASRVEAAGSGSTPMSISRVTVRGRVVGVQRAKHQVAGQRRLDGDLGGLQVADLADQDDVGVLAQDATAGARRRSGRSRA